jgi:hypothetical protein
MMMRHDLTELVRHCDVRRSEALSGLGLPPLYAPRYNILFIMREEWL